MVKLKRKKDSSEEATRRMESGEDRGRGKKRFVLIVGDDGAILVFMQGRKVLRRLFAPSPAPDHTASIVELMRSNARVPVQVLADVIDQQYVRHSFPPVSSLSVSGLVQRRMDRDFQAEDMKGALQLGRDKGGRREWNYLLIALANTQLMQRWLDLMVELPNEFKGIYLVPIESQLYIKALKKVIGGPDAPWQLLVSHHKVSGFRQVVLKEGRLVFTRVTHAMDDAVAAVTAGNIEQEILNTQEYLRRMEFSDNTSMEILVIAAQEVNEALDLKRFGAQNARALSPLEVCELLKLEQAALSADRFGDVVLATAFGVSKKHILRFMSAYPKQLAKMYLARRAMLAASTLIILSLAFMSISNLTQMVGDNQTAADLEAQRQPLQAELAVLQQSINGLDKDVAFKSAVVATYDAYVKDAPTPMGFVAQLAPLMPADVRVLAFDWKPVEVDPNAPPPADGIPLGPLEIKAQMEFTGAYPDAEALTRAAEGFITMMRQKLPQYDISHAQFPWAGTEQEGLEITLGQQQPVTPAGDAAPKVDITFIGPKPLPEGADASAPMAFGPGGASLGVTP